MTHTINYTAESESIDLQSAKSILDAVEGWADGDPDHHFDGIAYDNVNSGMRISVRVSGVEDIDQRLSDLDSGVTNINSGEGADFPPPSDVADIRPE